MPDRTCSVDGCGRPHMARGMCQIHYLRWYRRPDSEGQIRRVLGLPCSVDGCQRAAVARGWCSLHYKRWANHGSTDDPSVTAKAPTGTKRCSRCRCFKAISLFHKNRTERSGFSSWCKSCSREAQRLSYERNKAGYLRRARVRKSRLRGAAVSEPYTAEEIADRDGWRCQIAGCGKKINRKLKWPHPRSLSTDHIVPVSKGGDDVKANVQASHLCCNTSKGNRGTDQLRLIG